MVRISAVRVMRGLIRRERSRGYRGCRDVEYHDVRKSWVRNLQTKKRGAGTGFCRRHRGCGKDEENRQCLKQWIRELRGTQQRPPRVDREFLRRHGHSRRREPAPPSQSGIRRVMGIKNAQIIGRKIDNTSSSVKEGISDTGRRSRSWRRARPRTVLIQHDCRGERCSPRAYPSSTRTAGYPGLLQPPGHHRTQHLKEKQ